VAERNEHQNETRGKLSAQQLDLLVRDLQALPTFPDVVGRLAELSARARGERGRAARTAQADLIRLVRCDVSLTVRILSQANATSPGSADTVPQVAADSPAEWLVSTVLSTPVFSGADGGLDRAGFWTHSLAVACGAEMLAEQDGRREDPEAAFVCGLLHDVGMLVLDQAMPKSFRRALEGVEARRGQLMQLERDIIGTDHAVVGRRVAQQWQLPTAVESAIWLCGQNVDAIPASLPERRLVALVALADAIACEKGIGFSGCYAPASSSAEIAEHLGISDEVLQHVADGLGGAVEACCDLLGLSGRDGAGDETVALGAANVELGQVIEQLRRREETHKGRADAFRLVREFSGTLAPDGTVAEAVSRIAEMTAAALGCVVSPAEPIVAYCTPTGSEDILAASADGSQRPSMQTFEANETLASAPAVVVETPAREILAQMLVDPEDIAEWMDISTHFHWPLVCAGRWVGGVFYPKARHGSGDADDDVFEALADVLGLALAMVGGRSRAMELGEQLAGKSQALAAAQDALAEAKTLAAVGEMAAGAAHELNTPLAVVSGRAQLMQQRAEDDKQKKTWGLIADQSQRISDIISELMEFAAPPEPAATDFDGGELLREAGEAFSASEHPQAAAANVDIETEPGVPLVRADRAQIRGVIDELIENAANAAGAAPGVRLSCVSTEGAEAVLLSVVDDGPGMDRETAEQVFTPFYSSQAAGRRHGLGLPRAKRYVENNGGRIWVESRVGEGTTVRVRLPRAGG
jgi:putative nucleotidyltransferase with HDIG domain